MRSKELISSFDEKRLAELYSGEFFSSSCKTFQLVPLNNPEKYALKELREILVRYNRPEDLEASENASLINEFSYRGKLRLNSFIEKAEVIDEKIVSVFRLDLKKTTYLAGRIFDVPKTERAIVIISKFNENIFLHIFAARPISEKIKEKLVPFLLENNFVLQQCQLVHEDIIKVRKDLGGQTRTAQVKDILPELSSANFKGLNFDLIKKYSDFIGDGKTIGEFFMTKSYAGTYKDYSVIGISVDCLTYFNLTSPLLVA